MLSQPFATRLRILTAADFVADPSSGAAGTVHYTNAALRTLGHQVDEIWTEDLLSRRIAHGNLHSLIEQPWALKAAVQARCLKQQYDVVQISQPAAFAAATWLRRRGFAGLIVNRSHGVELRAHQVIGEWHRRLRIPVSRAPHFTRLLHRLLARQWQQVRGHCDGVVVGCELDREFLQNAGFAADRLRTIAHGVEPGMLSADQMPRSPHAGARILHVGQDAFFKGATLLPGIVNQVLAANRLATFTWVCAGVSHARILAAMHSEVRDRVTLLDAMPIQRLREVYDGHDVFVFPSLFEGFGKAAVEAMARGLCVVASDEGGMHDVIRNGETGWLCAVGDVDGFASRLLACLNQPLQSAAIAQRAAQAARAYSWDACAAAMVGFYQDLAATTGRQLVRE